jgi:hypothetical protein
MSDFVSCPHGVRNVTLIVGLATDRGMRAVLIRAVVALALVALGLLLTSAGPP